MQKWDYSINSLYKTGTLHLEEAPWWVFAIEKAVEWLCDNAPEDILSERPIKDKEGNNTTMREYYGTFNQYFCAVVHGPILNWSQNQKTTTFINVGYDTLHEKFYEGHEDYFDEEVKIGENEEEIE